LITSIILAGLGIGIYYIILSQQKDTIYIKEYKRQNVTIGEQEMQIRNFKAKVKTEDLSNEVEFEITTQSQLIQTRRVLDSG
jgi:hypothetical protein